MLHLAAREVYLLFTRLLFFIFFAPERATVFFFFVLPSVGTPLNIAPGSVECSPLGRRYSMILWSHIGKTKPKRMNCLIIFQIFFVWADPILS